MLSFVETTEFLHAFEHEVDELCHSEGPHWCDQENHHNCDLCDYIPNSIAELSSVHEQTTRLKADLEEQFEKLELSILYKEFKKSRAPPQMV